MSDAINHPRHYNAHPAGIECIDLVEALPFCQGNAIKYLWRADHKGAAREDLQKALWYVERAMKSPIAAVFDPRAFPPGLDHVLRRACSGFSGPVAQAIEAVALARLDVAHAALTFLIASRS